MSLVAPPAAPTAPVHVVVQTPPVKHTLTPRRLRLPRIHGSFVIPVSVPDAPGFAAADVRRPPATVAPIAETGNRLIVPAALALLLLVAASGSFLFLVERARRGWKPGLP